MKRFISGILIGSMIIAATTVFAESTQMIEAVFGRVQLTINGAPIEQETLLYDGIVYAPVQAVAESLGKVYTFDTDAQAAQVEEPKPEAVTQGDYSRENPAPLNAAQTVTVSSLRGEHTAAVRVLETLRGTEAWNKISAANPFNDEPEAGYEYILAKLAVSVISVKDDKAVSLSSVQFECYSSNNTEYDNMLMVVEPEPSLADSLFAGGNTEGYVVFQVKADDKAPKMAYGLSYDGSGGIWFSLQ